MGFFDFLNPPKINPLPKREETYDFQLINCDQCGKKLLYGETLDGECMPCVGKNR